MKTTRSLIGAQHHILGSMSNAAVQAALLDMLSLLIQHKDNEWHKATEKQLLKVFTQWKAEYGSRSPKTYRGSTGLGKRISIPFEAATPYECSDDAADYVSFCFLLLRSKYPPQIALTETEGIPNLLAVAAMIEPEMTRLDSMMQAIKLCLAATVHEYGRMDAVNSHLLVLIDDLKPAHKKELAKQKNLAGGRPAGAEQNRTDAEKRKAEAHAEGVLYFFDHPRANNDKCADFVAEKLKRPKSTVLKAISGCKAKALLKLEEEKNR